ncbi:hypothetical protein, partial [Azospirillum sp. TSO5]|uniref:hypothetical protein n=1 Tax=Azospirillum sp. TSO5 TaxID=716760 RepID=UPI000D620448
PARPLHRQCGWSYEGGLLLTAFKLLGHASKQMTLRYVHLAPDALDGAIMALNTGAAPAPHV